jgi:hypothetical protein
MHKKTCAKKYLVRKHVNYILFQSQLQQCTITLHYMRLHYAQENLRQKVSCASTCKLHFVSIAAATTLNYIALHSITLRTRKLAPKSILCVNM